MTQTIKDIARRLADLREVMEISQAEMAAFTGVSIEAYTALEAGGSDFSFSFIYKCAQRLGVEVTDLLGGSSPTLRSYSIVRAGEGLPIARRQGFFYNSLAPLFRNKLAEPFFVRANYSPDEHAGDYKIKLGSHPGQEIDIIIKGSLKIQVGGHVKILGAGDVIYYDSSTPHGMIAAGGEDCEFYAIVVEGTGVAYEYSGIREQDAGIREEAAADRFAGLICDKFIKTETDGHGIFSGIEFTGDDKFNFAFDVLDAIADKSPDKLAMLHLDNKKNERRISFGDMSRNSSKAAAYFKSLGIGRGDRVMLVLKRHYQFWYAMLGLHKLGAVAIPATNLLMTKDFEYRFKAAGVKAIICTADGDVARQAELAMPGCPGVTVKVIANGEREGWRSFDREIGDFPDTFERPADCACGSDPLLMFFTSGTTGYPKIAVQSHKYPLGHFITARYWHNVNPDGIHFTISDTGWGKALWGKLYGQWLCEAAIFTYDFDKFDAHDLLPLFAKHKITTFCAPPTMYRFFIKEDLSVYDLTSLEYATTAGEALNPEVFNQFERATGLRIMEGFGQTETTLCAANFIGMTPKLGSMGKPSPLFGLELMNPDGTFTATGEVGEIVLKYDKSALPCGLFDGYYLDEVRTAEACYDGYYHTGDTAWRDEDGYLWYVGRTDDLIKSSGYRIGPFEIESVIMELPYVLECAVTAAPDEIRGQVVKASVVLTRGTAAGDALKKEIQEYVKTHTAPYKYPRIVEFLPELPKTISGKIRRVELRDN